MGGIHEGHSMIPNKPPMGINVASDTKAGLRYADMIVDGHKTFESRNSDTLRPYVGKRVAIVRTGEGKAKAIGEVTVGEPKVVNQKQFRTMEDEHKVPKGSRFDINTPTKHLYPMHDPVRYDEERDVGHGIVSRKVIHKAKGGTVEPTIDEMKKALTKRSKVEVRPTVKDEGLMRKIPQMEEAARKVSEGKMSHEAYDKVVAKHKPVKPYEFVPQPASDADAHRALMENKKPHWRGHEDWPSGRKVGLRLDIPAYENHGVWVNSIHDEEGKGEDKRNTSYGSVSSVKNATFDAGPSKAIKVATGEQNKSPFARIKGELHHMSEDEAVEHMKKNLNHPDYAQVGMDPRRHGYFYDRKTMKPVTHAKHVVQIGPLVLAHKPTYGERDSYAQGGTVNAFDYENPKHVENVASIAAKHKDFKQIPDAAKHLAGSLSQGSYKFIEDPRIQSAIKQAGHSGYFINGKEGKQQIVRKATGGVVNPINQMKMELANKTRFKGLSQLQSIGAEEAPSLGIKAYVPTAGSPDNGQMPVGGVDTSQGDLPVGGIDMSKMQAGQQLMPAGQQQGMDQVPQGDKIPTMDGTGMPPAPNANPNQMGSNILSMTPQGQAMAAMKPQGLAKGGAVNMARGGMPFAIKAPQELPKAPSEFTPYDDTKPSIPTLSKAFDEAIAHHLSLSPEDRMINSQRAAMQVAQHTGMTSSNKPKDLLGQNEKLLKSGKGIEGQEPVKLPDGRGVETTGLALAPAYEEGNFNTCPNHHSCKAECLGKTSGNYFKLGGGQDLSEFKGPRLNSLLKTNAFLRDPHALAVKLYDEIDSAKQMAAANGNHLGVRLNVLSDINPRVHKAIIEAHPDVTFYDYTKNNTNPIAPNHHYTYSSTGVSQPGVENKHTNWKQMRRRLDQGDNVAMAFSHKDHLPEVVHDQETGKKYKVIDGDTHDFRPLDLVGEGEDGVIVGLKNKKATGKMDEAHIDSKGFFLHYDPQLKMSTNAKGQPVYARTASNRISEKTGKPMLGETIPQNRTVNIQPQTRGMIPLTNDGEKQ
jgi:hypothetical protein